MKDLVDLSKVCRENVIGTYLGLAKSFPGTQVCSEPDVSFARGRSDLSFCNFVIGFNNIEQIKLASIVSEAGRNYWAFEMPGDRPEGLSSMLSSLGFQPRNSLVQMARVSQAPRESLDLAPAKSFHARSSIANFMAQQFFWRLAPAIREAIGVATTVAPVELYGLHINSRLVGACMLSRQADSLGLYNVCVDGTCRRQGYGRQLVDFCCRRADQEGLPLVLQCDATLAPWYESTGFSRCGRMLAYKLNLSNQV